MPFTIVDAPADVQPTRLPHLPDSCVLDPVGSEYDVATMSAGDVDGSFGEQLRRYREAAGFSQEELAERAGLTPKGISALERGERRRPYPQTVRALAAGLGLNDSERSTLVSSIPSRSQPEPSAIEAASLVYPDVALPAEPTSLLGREQELEIIREQLVAREVRLLTLLGPGGVGKTRLAVSTARAFASGGFDQVCFVDLVNTQDPALVLPTVVRALRAGTATSDTTPSEVAAIVRGRSVLLVLDNFEQVTGASTGVGDVLASAPELTMLVTSREPLRLRWERTLLVQPLPLPDPRHLPPIHDLAAIPAIALFVDRARVTDPAFALTVENAAATAELCVRLDGLPLAIELVAARAAQLGIAATLDRLKRRLPLPTSFMHDAPARQHSLRATLEWSLDLLSDPERDLFRRLAVFAGGWTVDAAEAVAGEEIADPLGALLSLADKCLVVAERPPSTDGELRFRMLETAREVALDLLAARGEEDGVRIRHAAYFAALSEAMSEDLQGSGHTSAVRHIEREEDNFGQALQWAIATGRAEATEAAFRIVGSLGWYWFLHGYPPQARQWFDALLDDRGGDLEDTDARSLALRAKALNAAGFRATDHGEYRAGATFHEKALAIWRRLGDTRGLGASLHGVGDTALWQGDSALARATYDEGLALAKTEGTGEDVALFAFHLAQLSWLVGELEEGEQFGNDALVVGREAGSTTWPPYALYVLASLAHERGDIRRAGALYREAVELAWEHHDRLCVRMALPGLAALATLEGDPARALRLAGAASGLEENAGIWAFPPIRERHERWLESARAALDPADSDAAWAEGRALGIEGAIAYALEAADRTEPRTSSDPDRETLTSREQEVLTLVANGRSNREIGEALYVTEHTVKYHVASLFNKLGATTRAEAVARAASLGLLNSTD